MELTAVATGEVVILNGPPRAGKTSIARALQDAPGSPWITLGVDAAMRMTPAHFLPGVGLRPGGERPDLEPFIRAHFAALYDSVAAHARHGLNVAMDLSGHDAYPRPLGVHRDGALRLAGLPVLFAGVHCPLPVILQRRRDAGYLSAEAGEATTEPVLRWQREAHTPGLYDIEFDTSERSPAECASAIIDRLASGPPGTAFWRAWPPWPLAHGSHPR
ncbi:MAG: chloramphenicol phosphotransferase [Dehalococcoidia bacterium]|nr:chloramphenicol phosphotransferase [Dehalococcoidia bacterium]